MRSHSVSFLSYLFHLAWCPRGPLMLLQMARLPSFLLFNFDGDCSYEIKRCLLFGRKAMINLDRVLKNRDITLPRKVRIVKAMVFPVVTYGCENWIIKKTKNWRTESFKLWCWRRLLGVPWTGRRSNPINHEGNQPWIFIRISDAKAEAPILWPPDVKSQIIGKDPDAGKDEGRS